MVNKSRCIQDLKAKDYKVQREAIRSLSSFRDKEVIQAFIELLLINNNNSIITEVLLEEFKKIGGSYVIEELLKLLSHEEAAIRNFAFEVLLAIGNDDIDLIKKEINNKDDNVRKFIVDILGGLKNRTSVEVVMSKLEDEDINVVQGAIEALGNIKACIVQDKLLEMLLKSDYWLQITILDVLKNIGDYEAVKKINDIQWEDVAIKLNALDTVFTILENNKNFIDKHMVKEQKLFYSIKDLVRSGEKEIVFYALAFFSELEGPYKESLVSEGILSEDLFPYIYAHYKNSSEEDKLVVLKCFKYFNNSQAKEAILQALESKEEETISISLNYCIRNNLNKCSRYLRDFLKKDKLFLMTLEAIDKLGLKEFYNLLCEYYMNSESYTLRMKILEVLCNLNPKNNKFMEFIKENLSGNLLSDKALINVIQMAERTEDLTMIPYLEALYDDINIDISFAAEEAKNRLLEAYYES